MNLFKSQLNYVSIKRFFIYLISFIFSKIRCKFLGYKIFVEFDRNSTDFIGRIIIVWYTNRNSITYSIHDILPHFLLIYITDFLIYI